MDPYCHRESFLDLFPEKPHNRAYMEMNSVKGDTGVRGKKMLLAALLLLAVLLSVVLGLLWHMRHYVLVDLAFYPREAQQLDLRDQEITIRHYKKLRRRLPGCEIRWNVPFQDAAVPCDAREIALSALTQEDIRILEYFDRLETVQAESCTDYENLLLLQQQRPELQVNYRVTLDSEAYASDAEQVILGAVTKEELSLLQYLPKLKRVLCRGGTLESVSLLNAYCQEQQLEFLLTLGDAEIALDAQTVTAEAITEDQLGLLQFLPALQQLHIRLPEASPEKLLELKTARPDVAITWEQEICGELLPSDIEEIDLSEAEIDSLEELERQMAYFPDAKLVFLGECDFSNKALAAHRDQVRDRYKLVWTVYCGDDLPTRTDATTFMPVREEVYYFNDDEAYNLRYCEDMRCIDIGHMSIHNIDFVEYMPNLEYLILAHTQLQYIEPISSCKNLKFLELDWCPLKDLTPLKGCTALEDLNLGNTFADFTPVGEMTWLKNLWVIDCSTRSRYTMTQVLPDTKVMVSGPATVANGWRDLENYYAMRDLLGMHYMSW